MSNSALVIVTAGISSVALPQRMLTIDEGAIVGTFLFRCGILFLISLFFYSPNYEQPCRVLQASKEC